MNTLSVKVDGPAAAVAEARNDERAKRAHVPAMKWRTLLSLPAAVGIAIGAHVWASRNELPAPTELYTRFLLGALALAVGAGLLQLAWPRFRVWLAHMNPIFAGGLLLATAWEVVTTGLRLLPMPFFPGPALVLQSMLDDWKLLLQCAGHSLVLLSVGYLVGVAVGLVSGVCVGWFKSARYWGMPFLKMVGPLPATAWVPLAMALSPNGKISAIGLVALAVWFPVTMLTISGIANTKSSYLDVARTLGARPSFLIFRVAIPAAMPSIFIGLFMGLSTAFLTLIVAETVGVKAGLGWYVGWAQGWAEFGKVYAAMLIMAVFFSTIMTLLFKVRDRALVWQKGTIKW